MGVRLNTYSDSIGPAAVQASQTSRSSSSVIERHSAVQKLTSVNPWAIHSNEMTAVPIRSGLQFFADVPRGRRLQILFVPRLCRDPSIGKVNEPGAVAEPFSSRPRRSPTGDGRRPEFPIKSTESVPRPTQTVALVRQGVWSVTRKGIGLSLAAPVRRAGWLRPGPNSFVASAPPPVVGGRTRCRCGA